MASLYSIFDRLDRKLPTRHFEIHYGYRNARTGRGLGRHGVERYPQILEYAEALELGYERLSGPPISWPKPMPGEDRRIPVYVCDPTGGCFGFASLDLQGRTFLVLASRGNEPHSEDETHRACATAVHELTHAFTFARRPPAFVGEIPSRSVNPWEWFDEGTAVFVETHAYPGIRDCFRYFIDWCDRPYASLDSTTMAYQAGMFVYFLVRRFGHDLLTCVWELAPTYVTAIEAVEEALRQRKEVFACGNPQVADVFGAGYCTDAYFLGDPDSDCFNPGLLSRHGGRLVTQSFDFDSGTKKFPSDDDRVDHLACRYYQFWPPASSAVLEVAVEYQPPASIGHGSQAQAPLRAELHKVGPDGKRMRSAICLQPSRFAPNVLRLQGKVEGFSAAKLDHVVLIVANCAYGKDAQDGVTFKITAEVV